MATQLSVFNESMVFLKCIIVTITPSKIKIQVYAIIHE